MPTRTPLWTASGSGDTFESGFVTRDVGDDIAVESTDLALHTEALPTNTGTNSRMLIWPTGTRAVTDAESCATWTRRDGLYVQQGAALRVTRSGNRVRAVTVTQNIVYGAGWVFNVHTWDTAQAKPSTQIGQINLRSTFFADPTRPPPWGFCARVIGDRVAMKIWDADDQQEPAWGDPRHGGAINLPTGWQMPGQAGWYIGHLAAGDSADFAAASTATYDPTPEPEPVAGWVNDPAGPGRRTAVMADSLVSRHQDAWRTGPLASDGPLALWATSGAPFDAPGTWVPTLVPFPEVAVLAQGANSAWPLFGSDGWTDADRAALDRAAHRALAGTRVKGGFPGVSCVVLVTIGYPDGVHPSVKENDDNANADIRAKATTSPEYRLADWQAASAGQPWYEPDGLHLTAEGSTAYQQIITDAVRSCSPPA
ncbi:hypothetical protein PO878_14720 [Iamia majanohamensis]|uniref:Uncharacterized protein n=1 Tax=Iamia majanohamensis TaxID=467976 RepID=A0AAF0BUG3_9ACTN|nr:hypothetical protein [Iamia majanohamensis]WCO65755.1 hypothetical protein PO878_14720 [Iamia majanohamensis]